MTIDRKDVESLMRRCQIGCAGRQALNEAHNIMASCYGTLGALLSERDLMRTNEERYLWLRKWMIGNGLLHYYECASRPDRTSGPTWTLRSPYSIDAGDTLGWSVESYDAAIDAAMKDAP